MILEVGGGRKKGLNEGVRRVGNGSRKGKLKRTEEGAGVGEKGEETLLVYSQTKTLTWLMSQT